MIEIIILVVGFAIGWFGREQYAKYVIAQYTKYLASQISAVKQIHVRIEKSGKQLFVYNNETNEFLAQGSTHKEVEDILFKRFPGVFFTASKDNIQEVGYRNDTF